MRFKYFIFVTCNLIVSMYADHWSSQHQEIMEHNMEGNDMEDDVCFDSVPSYSRRTNTPAYCTRTSGVYSPTFRRSVSETTCYNYLWDLISGDFERMKIKACSKYSPSRRMSEGSYSTTFESPHVGAVGWKLKAGGRAFLCGSTLITHVFFVTAAYCTSIKRHDLSSDRPFEVVLRDDNLLQRDRKGKRYQIKEIFQHPEYDPTKKLNDIGILKVQNSVEFTHGIQPACLWTYDDMGDLYDNLQMVGYGSVNDDELKLRSGTVLIPDESKCPDIGHGQMCVGTSERKGANMYTQGPNSCKVDTGGPLQLAMPLKNNTFGKMSFLVGVMSVYDSCYDTKPRVHTKVSSYQDWIERIVWPKKVLPEAKGEAELFILPDAFDSGQIVYLELESFTGDSFSVALIADNYGVDYNNIVFKAFLDLPNNKLELETLKDGIFQGPENPGYLPGHVFIDNMLDISFRITTDPDNNKDFLDVRMGRGNIYIPMVPVHNISSMRYIEVKGEKTFIKTFRSTYTKIPYDY